MAKLMLNTIMSNYLSEIKNWLDCHKSTTLPAWMKRNPKIKEWVQSSTRQHTPENIMESVYILLNGIPNCCDCGNKLKFNTFDLGYRVGCSLGNQCVSVAKNRLANQKQTLLEKYGVDSTEKIQGVKEKRKATMQARYGVDYAMHSALLVEKRKASDQKNTIEDWQIINEKRKNTSKQKYGVDHHMKLSQQKAKVKSTNLKKYGVEFPLQSELIKQKLIDTYASKTDIEKQITVTKIKNTILEKHGVDAGSRIGMNLESLETLKNSDLFKETIQGLTRKQAIEKLNISKHTLYIYSKKYNTSDLFQRPLTSQFEQEVFDYITSLGFTPELGNRSIIAPQELDIFIPEKNLAIECCGLYWHAENSAGRQKNYHFNKFLQCYEKNITLITIFEDEWQRLPGVKSRLEHLLKKHKSKIFARHCIVRELDSFESSTFINIYHLQGNVNSTIKLGLDYNGEIVAVMTFRQPRFNNAFQYEIIRFCTKEHVPGAAGKLFSYFLKKYNPKSVLSYSDNRWGDGSVYKNLGFNKDTTSVGFYYTDYKNRYDRVRFQKHKLKSILKTFDSSLTEWQNMQKNSYDRIWDCGQTRWVYINNHNGDNE